jgi:1-phosphofructokinase
LPKGVEASFYGEVIKKIPKNVKVIIDAERNNALSAIESREVFMVKPNLVELEGFAQTKIRTIPDILKACQKYFDKGVQNVMVSMGGDGAVLTNGSTAYFCKSLSVAVNSTVGAGDSMVAATSVAFDKGLPLGEVLRQAVSAGTAAVTTSGTNLFYKEKFDEIYSKVYPEKIF